MDTVSNKNSDNTNPDSTSNDDNNHAIRRIDIANRADEFGPMGSSDSTWVTGSSDYTRVTVTRSSRIFEPYDWSKHFPDTP